MTAITIHTKETDEIQVRFDCGLVVSATKCAEDQWGTAEAAPLVCFHYGREDFTELTGSGFFSTLAKVRAALMSIEDKLGPAWVASTDCPKRRRAYSRYLPQNRILSV